MLQPCVPPHFFGWFFLHQGLPVLKKPTALQISNAANMHACGLQHCKLHVHAHGKAPNSARLNSLFYYTHTILIFWYFHLLWLDCKQQPTISKGLPSTSLHHTMGQALTRVCYVQQRDMAAFGLPQHPGEFREDFFLAEADLLLGLPLWKCDSTVPPRQSNARQNSQRAW